MLTDNRQLKKQKNELYPQFYFSIFHERDSPSVISLLRSIYVEVKPCHKDIMRRAKILLTKNRAWHSSRLSRDVLMPQSSGSIYDSRRYRSCEISVLLLRLGLIGRPGSGLRIAWQRERPCH